MNPAGTRDYRRENLVSMSETNWPAVQKIGFIFQNYNLLAPPP
jgi:ABC-type lipoprotein export system ATPase subunit